jgi:regulator of RNase E activity RraB
MSEKCGNCGCGSHASDDNCSSQQLSEEEIEKILKDKSEHSRKYTVEYRIKLEDMECTAEELIDRIKAYSGVIDQIEFAEEELIISYDDRLITPAEISHLIQ